MADYINDNEIPVFLINGFLEAGKTAFIKYTMGEEYFQIEGKTLLIVCEEGEVEYRPEELREYDTTMVIIDSEANMTKQYLEELSRRYRPERVIIEFNGMWNMDQLSLPSDWALYQQVTIMDGTTLSQYLGNMKALMGPMLRNSELCIVNRCDGKTTEELVEWKRKLRPMLLSGSDIVFENKDGEVPMEILPEELPYDLNADVIRIKPEEYGIWFFDTKDNLKRYVGKTVEFTACIMKSKDFGKDCFVPGRMAMTCCEADMTFIGFLAHSPSLSSFQDHAWVKVRAKIEAKERKEYGGVGPFLEVESMSLTGEIREPVAF